MNRVGLGGFRRGHFQRAAAGAALALAFTVGAAFAAEGQILSLTATDGSNPGDTITVESTVQAEGKIQRSNLYYEIIAPDGTTVATHPTDLGDLRDGETFSDSWSVGNSAFPEMGTYTVTLCWSPGKSHNCDIDLASTTFYSVPTLGWTLGLLALGLLAVFLWRQRGDFAGAAT